MLGNGNAASTAGTFASSGNWNYDEEVDYSFGYGLSYTQFSQEITAFEVKDDMLVFGILSAFFVWDKEESK